MQAVVPPRPVDRADEPIAFVAGLASRLAGERSIGGACLLVIEEAMALTGARCGEVLFRDLESKQFICLAHRGPHPWCVSQTGGPRLSTRLLEATLQDHLPLYLADAPAEADMHLSADSELAQSLSIPLVVRGRAHGVLNLCGTREASFPADAVAVLSILVNLLALTIENLYISERTTSEENARRRFLVHELEATEDERQRIARELHDGLGQTLTGLLMNIDAAMALFPHADRADLAMQRLGQSREIAAGALQDIRRVILALRPTVLEDLGLIAAVEGYARRVLGEAGIRVTVRRRQVNGSRASSVVENVVYRVVQEAVSNVARHSGARSCRIALACLDGTISASVEDDGAGFDVGLSTNVAGHYGLSSMRERVNVIGGTLRIESALGCGTRVSVRVPSRGRQSHEDQRSHR